MNKVKGSNSVRILAQQKRKCKSVNTLNGMKILLCVLCVTFALFAVKKSCSPPDTVVTPRISGIMRTICTVFVAEQ